MKRLIICLIIMQVMVIKFTYAKTVPTILFVGTTGQGKSSAIMTLDNIAKDKKYNDEKKEFIIDEAPVKEGESVTKTSSIYDISHEGQRLRIIDTPGFGDTATGESKFTDDMIFNNIIDCLNTTEIHAIFVVMHGTSTNRIVEPLRNLKEKLEKSFSGIVDWKKSLFSLYTHLDDNQRVPKSVETVVQAFGIEPKNSFSVSSLSLKNTDSNIDADARFSLEEDGIEESDPGFKTSLEIEKGEVKKRYEKSWDKNKRSLARIIERVSSLPALETHQFKDKKDTIKRIASNLDTVLEKEWELNELRNQKAEKQTELDKENTKVTKNSNYQVKTETKGTKYHLKGVMGEECSSNDDGDFSKFYVKKDSTETYTANIPLLERSDNGSVCAENQTKVGGKEFQLVDEVVGQEYHEKWRVLGAKHGKYRDVWGKVSRCTICGGKESEHKITYRMLTRDKTVSKTVCPNCDQAPASHSIKEESVVTGSEEKTNDKMKKIHDVAKKKAEKIQKDIKGLEEKISKLEVEIKGLDKKIKEADKKLAGFGLYDQVLEVIKELKRDLESKEDDRKKYDFKVEILKKKKVDWKLASKKK